LKVAWTAKELGQSSYRSFRSVEFTPDGRGLLVTIENLVALLSMEDGKPIWTLDTKEWASASLSGDGRSVAVVTFETRFVCRLWDPRSSTPLLEATGSWGAMQAFFRGGEAQLVAEKAGDTLLVESFPTGSRIASFTLSSGRFTTVDFSRNCHRILAGDDMGGVHVLELR
jgi:hypothetical protein